MPSPNNYFAPIQSWPARGFRTGNLYFDTVRASIATVGPASSGGAGGGIVDDLAELTASPDVTEGKVLYVKTLDSDFRAIDSDLAPLQDFVVVPSSDANLVWERLFSPSERWASQENWEYNAVTGNDENDGLSDTPGPGHTGPIKSLDEFSRRLARAKNPVGIVGYSILANTSIPQTDTLRFSALVDPGLGADEPAVFIVGQSTQVFPATGDQAIAAIVVGASAPGGGTKSQFDGGAGFVAGAHLNQQIQITTGFSAGAINWIAADLGGQLAQVGDWVSSNGFPMAPPAPGDRYVVVTKTNCKASVKSVGYSTGPRLHLIDLDVDPQFSIDNFNGSGIRVTGCSVRARIVGGNVSFSACNIQPAGFFDQSWDSGWVRFLGCVINGTIHLSNTVHGFFMVDTTVVGGIIDMVRVNPFFGLAPGENPGHKLILTSFGGSGVSVWDAPAASPAAPGAVALARGARLYVAGPLYGKSPLSDCGLFAADGSICFVAEGVTPTITAPAHQDIKIDNDDVIPTISAVTGLPVAGASVTAWTGAGGWDDAGTYNRFINNLKNGTRIISYA